MPCFKISAQGSTRSDNCFHSNFQPLNDSGTTTNECPALDLHTTAERGAWCDMDILTQPAIVIDSGAGVDDGISTYDHICLNHCTRHDLDAFVKDRTLVYPCRWMHEDRKAKPLLLETLKDTPSPRAANQLPKTVDQFDRPWVKRFKCVVTTENRNSAPLFDSLVCQRWITYPQHFKTNRLDERQENLGMSTGPQDHQRLMTVQGSIFSPTE